MRPTLTKLIDLIAFHTRPRYRLRVSRHMCVWKVPALGAREDVAEWCETMMPGRWRITFTSDRRNGEFHFRHQADLVLFMLMWGEEIADTRLRVPGDIWPMIERR